MVNKIIHIADINLNYEYGILLNQLQREPELEGYNFKSFRNFMESLELSEVNRILITGKIFDFQGIELALLNDWLELLQSYNQYEFILSPSLCDLGVDSWFDIVEWPENVSILRNNAYILDESLGMLYYRGEVEEHIRTSSHRKIRITDVSKDQVIPFADELYIALGDEPHFYGNGIIASPGSFEPMGFSESQVVGYIELLIEEGHCQQQFIERNGLKLVEKMIEIKPEDGYEDIAFKIKKTMTEQGVYVYYRIVLTGNVRYDLKDNLINNIKAFVDTPIKGIWVDQTNKDYYVNEIEKQNGDNLIGKFIQNIQKKEMDDKEKYDVIECGLDYLL